MYSIKMRASKDDIHLSGAERIVSRKDLPQIIDSLLERGLDHERGEADFLNLKIEKLNDEEILKIKPLKTRTIEVNSKEEGFREIEKVLKSINIKYPKEVIELLTQSEDMRGAIILDIHSFKRLEEDSKRGIRVSYMDYLETDFSKKKNHYKEALALSSKTMNCKAIIGEVCISDDPDYITGYVSTKEEYIRITKLKDKGSRKGGRVFLFDKNIDSLENTIEYLTQRRVLIV